MWAVYLLASPNSRHLRRDGPRPLQRRRTPPKTSRAVSRPRPLVLPRRHGGRQRARFLGKAARARERTRGRGGLLALLALGPAVFWEDLRDGLEGMGQGL
jgi:hypothetical protein